MIKLLNCCTLWKCHAYDINNYHQGIRELHLYIFRAYAYVPRAAKSRPLEISSAYLRKLPKNIWGCFLPHPVYSVMVRVLAKYMQCSSLRNTDTTAEINNIAVTNNKRQQLDCQAFPTRHDRMTLHWGFVIQRFSLIRKRIYLRHFGPRSSFLHKC